MSTATSILLAEDDDTDILLIQRAFKHVALDHPVQIVRDGEEAIAFLSQPRTVPNDRLPGLVILDVKMPKRSGLEVLEWMRQQPVLCCLPAMIFSSSAHPADVERAYCLGANAYLVKPPSTEQCVEVARFVKDWMKLIQPALSTVEGFHAALKAHSSGSFKRQWS